MTPIEPTLSIKPSAVSGVALYEATEIEDPRGFLVASQYPTSIPFIPKRVFLVYDVPSEEVRGAHAHIACHQFLVAVHGSVTVEVDDGTCRETFVLDRPNKGLYVPPMIWASEYAYSGDARQMCLASDPYDPADYIRDYDEYLARTSSH